MKNKNTLRQYLHGLRKQIEIDSYKQEKEYTPPTVKNIDKITEALGYYVTDIISSYSSLICDNDGDVEIDLSILEITLKGEKVLAKTKKGTYEIEIADETFIEFGYKFYGAVISYK